KADLLSFWGYLYRNQAQYERSDSLFASAASIYDSLPEAPVRERIFNLREWSNTMFYAGKLDEADSLLQIAGGLLPAKGLDRDTTLASLHRSRGDIAYEMGAYDQADSLYQLAYDWHHDQGEDSLDLAIAIHSLGMTARKRSDFAEADSLFRLSLTIKRSILEEPHSEIAYTLNYLASLAWDQGFHEKSKAYAAASLRQRKAIFVPHHPEIMASMGNYARSLMKLEQFDSAKVMYEQMSVSVEKSFGTKEHPYYAMLQQNQAACLLYTKRYEEAEAAYVALGPLYQKVFPAGHLQHATYNLRLGEVKLKQGAFREAVPYLQESLNLREEKRGKESREYADVAYLLGQCYDGLSQTQKARPYLEQALAVFRNTPVRYENSIAKIEAMLK
ncbi:MAG: tetratricopeptide repeat protein, partial [Bacteroidota bacterium]